MSPTHADLTARLLERLRSVQKNLGQEPTADRPDVRFADELDSMGLVEFLTLVAADCGVTVERIEEAVGRRFGTVAEMVVALEAAGLRPISETGARSLPDSTLDLVAALVWLASIRVRLPRTVQSASALDALLQRPAGWLAKRAGIHERRVWAKRDPLDAATEAGRECLEKLGMSVRDVGALLVTSEAPPLLVGLAAALHHRLGLPSATGALEIGGACTGFLAALWTARRLLPERGAILLLALEAHSLRLPVRPGPAGEAAALFGDGAAACIVCAAPAGPSSIPVQDVILGADGGAASLIQVRPTPGGDAELCMDGTALAARAVRVMVRAVRDVTCRQGLTVADLDGVVAHGGNGRMPALLARQLGLPPGKVWSETARTGNLGSASLPAAWAARVPPPTGPVAWVAVGAGLTWAATLTGKVVG
jgi:3-oxoacyl-[acyl-carrier-protein] synthase-3